MFFLVRIKVRGHLVMSIIQFINLVSVHYLGEPYTYCLCSRHIIGKGKDGGGGGGEAEKK